MKKYFKLCISGGKIIENDNKKRLVNEDIVVAGNNYAILMDGATGLGKNRFVGDNTLVEWYVSQVAKSVENQILKDKDFNLDLQEIVKSTVLEVKAKIKIYENEIGEVLKKYEEPSACLAIIRELKDDYTEIFILGDISIYIKKLNGDTCQIANPSKDVLNSLDNTVYNKMKEIAKQNNLDVIDTREFKEVKELLEKNRSCKNNINSKTPYWIMGTDLTAVNNAVNIKIKTSDIDKIIMCSDGFNLNILNIQVSEIFEIVNSEEDVKILAQNIRQLEEEDSKCNKYPRFKKSDDLSFLMIMK